MIQEHGALLVRRCAFGAARSDTAKASIPVGLRRLYARLGSAGFSRPYIRQTVLPGWWQDEAAQNPTGFAELHVLLARHLGLDLDSLEDETKPLAFAPSGPTKLKKAVDVAEEDLAVARAIATRAANLAAAAAPTDHGAIPFSASEIRDQILATGQPWVSLDNLLDWCWSRGVPVLHVSVFPRSARKMDGLAARVQGHPVIIVSKNSHSPAWLLFIVAHELGHIALGHVEDEGILIDDRVEQQGADEEERAADAFALELLTGRPDCKFTAPARWPNAQQLAKDADRIGRRLKIDPGHVALNYGHSMGRTFFPVAQAALKLLEHADGPAILRAKMEERLDWSGLPADSCEFLQRVTRAEQTPV